MATKKADGILDGLNRRTVLKTQEVTLYAALIRLHVDHCVQFSATHIGRVQTNWSRSRNGQENNHGTGK